MPVRMPSDWLRGVDGVFSTLQLSGVAIEENEIRKRPADVDAEPQHSHSPAQRPVKFGRRFSMKARAPSR